MNDAKDDIRELLNQKAKEIPPHLEVPTSLTRRVRPRIAMNVLAVGAAVALIAVGVFAGLRVFNEPHASTPLTSNSPAPSVAGSSTCAFDQLEASVAFEGAAGSREGTVDLRNTAGGSCTLQGTPDVALTDSDGHPIDGVTVLGSPPGWKVEGAPEPDGWPVVTLVSGDIASVRIRWSNWCDSPATPSLRLSTPGGADAATITMDAMSVPPCNGEGMPSTLEVGPFEPKLSG